VQQEVSVQKEKLEVLDGEVSHHRDLLTHLKHERDRLRGENQKLKQQGGMMDSEGLLEDFEAREEATIQLTERLTYLKAKHAEYTNIILAANQASANVEAGGSMM
jgi:hypothetical protein